MIFLQDTGNKHCQGFTWNQQAAAGTQPHRGRCLLSTTFEWIPETSIKKQILKEATFYRLCIKTFNIKLYHLMPETKGTRITCLEQQYTSQTAFKQDK